MIKAEKLPFALYCYLQWNDTYACMQSSRQKKWRIQQIQKLEKSLPRNLIRKCQIDQVDSRGSLSHVKHIQIQ